MFPWSVSAQFCSVLACSTNAPQFQLTACFTVPLVNPDHLDIIPLQRAKRGLKKGFLVCNANCSTTGLVVPLKPIQEAFGIESMVVTTMQAISGAGYPGVSSMDIFDNVVPYISGEEDKVSRSLFCVFVKARQQ